MARKAVAKEDGEEDDGEVRHVHGAVVDRLHHDVQPGVRLEGLEELEDQNKEVAKEEGAQQHVQVVDLPGHHEDRVDLRVQCSGLDDLRQRVLGSDGYV